MKKPRCFHCSAALKRVYERNGSDARFDKVEGWWYCNDCRKVQKGPQYPSENPDDYLDKEAASKFPTISHVMQHSNKYIDIDELKGGFYQNVDDDPEVNFYRNGDDNSERAAKWDEVMSFFMRGQRLRHTLLAKDENLQPFWKCVECDHLIPVDQDHLDEGDIEVPTHCNVDMKMTIAPLGEQKNVIALLWEEIDSIRSEYQRAKDEGDIERAGHRLLDLTLTYLANPPQAFTLHRESFEDFIVELRNPKSLLHDTWGFEVLISLVQAYVMPNSELELSLLKKQYDHIQLTDFEEYDESIAIIKSVISDIITIISIDDTLNSASKVKLIPYYRQLCNKIVLNIHHRQIFRVKMREFSRLKSLQYPQQVTEELQKIKV